MSVSIRSSFKLTGFDTSRLKTRVPVILRAYDKILFPAFKAEISTAQFEWPNVTLRTGKAARKAAQPGKGKRIPTVALAGSPRDIVDTGKFRASQQRKGIGPGATSITYTWGGPQAPYAPLLLTGYTTSTGARFPARDWIKPALAKNPLSDFFAAEWARLAARRL